MTTSSTFTIVGGILAGAKAAEALRDNDFNGHVVLYAAEDHLPYERPPLSKEYLAGKKKLAGMNVNIWEGLDDIKSLIRSREPVDADQLADAR